MISVILPISRTEYLRPVFECLDKLERPDDTELLIITDGDEAMRENVGRRIGTIQYKSISVINYGDGPAQDRGERRFRISAIHNKAKYLVSEDTEFVFLIEDDTVYPPNALSRLMSLMQDNVAFASGMELARWNAPHLGAWKADDVREPRAITSITPSKGIEEVDASGFYCALIDARLYRNYHFKPYDIKGKNGLSCDVNFGLTMRRKGYKVLVDHDLQCDHIGERGSVNLGNTTPCQVQFRKRNGVWGAMKI